MKFKLLLLALSAIFLLWLSATAVLAQGEPPSPYAGLKNPFPWEDPSARETGKGLYQQSCLGCHGVKGNSMKGFDFSTADFSQGLEKRADFYFWVLSEGRLDKGMPAYKSSLSEEQRWQVLTYLWSLGAESPAEVTAPPAQPPAGAAGGNLLLTAPEQAQAGQPVTISVSLQDKEGKPLSRAVIKFFTRADFFTTGLMEIGEVVTNDQGVAVFEYLPRQAGDIEVVARYDDVEATSRLSLVEAAESFYQAEAGLRLPAPGEPVFIGPKSALELGEMGKAPTSAFYLPGGIISWLLFLVVTVGLIWSTYFRVMYQAFRIPIASEIRDTDTRLIPLVGLSIVVVLGILLVLMLLTGPYTHFHLMR